MKIRGSNTPRGDLYCRPYIYCRWKQFMPGLVAHIVTQKIITEFNEC